MKVSAFKYRPVVMAALMLVVLSPTISAQEASREIRKSYQVDQEFRLGIENKYGSIDIVNWDRDEMEVTVTITVEARNEAKSKEVLEQITIDIDESSSGVDFETIFEWKSLKNTDVEVAYKVKAPEYLAADLVMKYGSMYIQTLTGRLDLTVKYGSINATNLVNRDRNGWNELDFAYSEGSIEQVGNLDVKIAYSELDMGEANMLNMQSSYSEFSAEFVGGIELVSRYDDFAIEEVVDWKSEMKYGDVSIGQLNNSFEINASYTDVTIDRILENFSRIVADMNYGDLTGDVAPGTGFTISAETRYGDIDLPEGNYSLKEKGNVVTAEGAVGRSSNAEVRVNLSYGDLDLD